MNEIINIKGIDKARILAALYNASKQQGMGFLHTKGAAGKDMSTAEAQAEIDARLAHGGPAAAIYFDYLHGRVMKVDLTGDELDPWGYDRDNGAGAAERALIDAGLL